MVESYSQYNVRYINQDQEEARNRKAFMDWCQDVGIEFPGQEYPAFFNNGSLIGVRATQPIAYRQAYLKVPYNCLMTVSEAQMHPKLAQIIRENPDLFSEEEQTGWK